MEEEKLLSEELIAKIKGIQIRAKHLVNDLFAGEYISAFKGRGMEFEEVREYLPGDDIRNIDWNVTARSNKPFIKTYRDERELTVLFVIDVSASSRYGTVHKFKNEVAAEIAALLSYAALKNNDKVGLVIFSDHVEHFVPPKKGRGHVWRIIREVLTYESNSNKTDLNVPLEFLSQVIKKRAITFVISDFQQEGYEQKLRAIANLHDVIAISITDPTELKLPKIGFIELEDAETGDFFVVNTSDKKLMKAYEAESAGRLQSNKKFFEANGIDFIDIKTEKNYIDPIIKFFKVRDKRKR